MYNLTKDDSKQITDITMVKCPNEGRYSKQKCNIKCNNVIENEQIQKFIKSSATISPTGNLGGTSLPPIGDSGMYIETSNNNSISTIVNHVSVSFERKGIIQTSHNSCNYNMISS